MRSRRGGVRTVTIVNICNTPIHSACGADLFREGKTYALRLARADLVRQARDEARVAHEDSRLDLVDGRGLDLHRRVGEALVGVAAAAEGVVEDLPALRVSDDHELRRRALVVEGVDLRLHGRDTLLDGVGVADAAAARLSAAGWVGDGLGGRAGVGVEDGVDDGASAAVAWSNGGLAGTEDVDVGAGALSEDDWRGQGAAQEEQSSCEHEHCVKMNIKTMNDRMRLFKGAMRGAGCTEP